MAAYEIRSLRETQVVQINSILISRICIIRHDSILYVWIFKLHRLI